MVKVLVRVKLHVWQQLLGWFRFASEGLIEAASFVFQIVAHIALGPKPVLAWWSWQLQPIGFPEARNACGPKR